MKVVTKVLANRLKSVMPKLTNMYQSSFITSKLTIDNIIIAREVLHTLAKRKGRNGALVLKVDLEKTYDIVE